MLDGKMFCSPMFSLVGVCFISGIAHIFHTGMIVLAMWMLFCLPLSIDVFQRITPYFDSA